MHESPTHDGIMDLLHRATVPGSFAYTSPYQSCWLVDYYRMIGSDLYRKKVVRESDFVHLLDEVDGLPELMIMGNFVADRAGILSRCRRLGIDTVHGEDGFFPHYETMHADPLGFAWESSLARTDFIGVSESSKTKAAHFRSQYLQARGQPRIHLATIIQKPYVLWPLQLIGDKVNTWGLNLTEWVPLLKHFRACLPTEFELVVKPHPRSRGRDLNGVGDLIAKTVGLTLVPTGIELHDLLANCSGVAGANSSVLYEARLLYDKPTYAYAGGWFSGHQSLIFPSWIQEAPRELASVELLVNSNLRTDYDDDYRDWFLAQLLSRQFSIAEAKDDPDKFGQWLKTRTYKAWISSGRSLFDD